jgi:hypothetical protein
LHTGARMRTQWLLGLSVTALCSCATTTPSIEISITDGKADGFQNTFPALDNTLYPFETDGCSNFPNGDWGDCCKVHDLAYWAGGTESDREQADSNLRDCVAATGNPEIAGVMYTGVRAFGGPEQITTYRWGFGWQYNRDYKALTPDQQQLVASMSPADPTSVPITPATRLVQPYPTLSGDYCNDEAYYGFRSLLRPDDLARLTQFHGVVDAPNLSVQITTNVCHDSLAARLSVALLSDQQGCATPRYTDEQPTHFLAAIDADGDCVSLLQ